MRRAFPLLLLPLLAIAAPSYADMTPPAQKTLSPPGLVSHRAVYDLRLIEGGGAKAPVSASGRILFDFANACDSYVQTLRQAIDLEPNEGERKLTDSMSTTSETVDGGDFRFKTSRSDEVGGDVFGSARRGADGVAIALSRPAPFRRAADGDVLFPSQHIAALIAAARRGDKILLAKVFDGSDDGRKIFDVTAVIGPPRADPDSDRGARQRGLDDLVRWPVAVSYFPQERRDGPPDYVLSFDLYENGVSSHLKLDYGDFALAGELVDLAFPPAIGCGKK